MGALCMDFISGHDIGIEAGTIHVHVLLDGYPELPFGGYHQSGLGPEPGRHAGEDCTVTPSVLRHCSI